MEEMKKEERERIMIIEGEMGKKIKGMGLNEENFRGDSLEKCE